MGLKIVEDSEKSSPQSEEPVKYQEKPFEKITSKDVGNAIKTTAVIKHVTKPAPTLRVAAYECLNCMRIYKVEIENPFSILEPAVCQECGGRSFKLLTRESKYYDKQELTVSTNNTTKTLKVLLSDKDTSHDIYHPHQEVQLVGQLTVKRIKRALEVWLYCFDIQILQDVEMIQENCEYSRDSLEYKKWRKAILQRDETCQICGGTKHLEVHHLYNYKEYSELRVDEDNGIVLCSFCHNKFHSYYGKQGTPVDLVKFIMEFGKW